MRVHDPNDMMGFGAKRPAWFMVLPAVLVIGLVAGLSGCLRPPPETRTQLQCRSAVGNFDSGWQLKVRHVGASVFAIDTGGQMLFYTAPAGALCRVDVAVVNDVPRGQIHAY